VVEFLCRKLDFGRIIFKTLPKNNKIVGFFFLWPLINRCYNLYNIYGMYPIWDVSYDIHVSEQFNYIIVSEAILYISKNSYQIPNL
jgi:hypothetical protein